MVLLLVVGGLQVPAEPETVVAGAITNTVDNGEATVPDAEAVETPADTDAPAKLISEQKPLPPTIRPSSPVAEVIKLANSGVDESVLLTYVTNSVHTFNLGADEIIYLNDIGVPGGVVTAMIQRDEVLKTQYASAANPPPAPPAAPESTQMSAEWPPAPEVAPQPADSGAGYAVEAPLTPSEEGTDAMFYDSLAPYGNWVDVSGYGLCWQPTAVVITRGWQPYYNCGHWVYSDCGWYWVSDYTWGWAPFHYGRWFRHAHLGWCWVPGRTWAPSWVSWRYNDHYCGWAPLPPGARYYGGYGLAWHGHRANEHDDFGLSPGHYRFVGWTQFHDRQFRGPSLTPHERDRVYANSTASTRIAGNNQTLINNGLPVSRVAAATHRPIQTVALRDSTSPASPTGRAERYEANGRTLTVYRPNPALAERNGNRNRTPGATRSVTANANPGTGPAWVTTAGQAYHNPTAKPGTTTTSTQPGPMILRGSQPSAAHETAPPNSVIVIGRRDGPASSVPSQSSAAPAASASPAPSARPDSHQPNTYATSPGSPRAGRPEASTRPAASTGTERHNWMGTVTSSPQPEWFARSPAAAQARPSSAPMSVPQTRSYQPAPRPSVPEVPRYAPSPSYNAPQRSYSAPPASVPRE